MSSGVDYGTGVKGTFYRTCDTLRFKIQNMDHHDRVAAGALFVGALISPLKKCRYGLAPLSFGLSYFAGRGLIALSPRSFRDRHHLSQRSEGHVMTIIKVLFVSSWVISVKYRKAFLLSMGCGIILSGVVGLGLREIKPIAPTHKFAVH